MTQPTRAAASFRCFLSTVSCRKSYGVTSVWISATPAALGELLANCRPEQESDLKAPGLSTAQGTEKAESQPRPVAVLERELTGHKGWVRSVVVEPRGTWAASGSHDKTVKIWDLDTGVCELTLSGHKGSVLSVSITPDSERILSASWLIRPFAFGIRTQAVSCQSWIAIWTMFGRWSRCQTIGTLFREGSTKLSCFGTLSLKNV